MEIEVNKKFRLPKEFAEKWLEALRSGKYNQAKGALYSPKNDGYCCLGVACRIYYNKSDLLVKGYQNEHQLYGLIISLTHSDGIKKDLEKIPNELKGSADTNKLVRELTTLNDSGRYDFNQIADWIEKNIEFYE